MRIIKICFIIGSLSFSGAEKVASALSLQMTNYGHKIDFILLESTWGSLNYKKNITLHGSYVKDDCKLFRLLKRFWSIRKLIKSIQPDIVISFGNVSNLNTIVAMISLATPLIICERNDPIHDPRNITSRIARRFLYQLVDGYVFQTEEIRNYFIKKGNKNFKVIPNPVIDVSHIKVEIKSKVKKIVTLSRLDDHQKNLTMLINSFSRIVKINPDIQLLIYGDGPDKQKYIELTKELKIGSNVNFMGKTKDSIKALLDSDLFVLTSNFEGMPNALIEALSLGLPTIATDCSGGGARSLITNNINGILVPIGKTDEFTDKLLELINNHELRLEFHRNSQRINETHNINIITNLWLDFLLHTIRRKNEN